MNNLKLYSCISQDLSFQSHQDSILFSTLDLERNRLFFATSSNLIYVFLNANDVSSPFQVHPIELETDDFVTSFDYVIEKESLIIGTNNGLLILYSVDDDVTEIVGRVDGGVKSVNPSPDGDLIAILTGLGRLLVMTHDWDVLYENEIDEADVNGESESSVSWRGDGKYLATLSELNRRIKVWERDSGALHSDSGCQAFMGTVLAWMPSGAKIAAVYDKRVENKCPEVIFYERNGLIRSSFSINESVNAKVEVLKWNCSSDLLAAVVRCDGYDVIKIWSFSNYHWYLKHEIRYGREDGVRFMWDPIKPFQLFCWTLKGQVTVYNFIWVSAVMDNSIALVIDGSKILVTPLSLSLIPPPLYLFSLNFTSAVRDVSLYSRNCKNCVAAFLSDGSLSMVELPDSDSWEELEDKEFTVDVTTSEIALGFFIHLKWLDSRILLAVSHHGFSHSHSVKSKSLDKDGLCGFYLQEIELSCSEDHVAGLVAASGWHAKISHINRLERIVIGIAPNPTTICSAYVQYDGGEIFEYTSKAGFAAIGGGSRKYSNLAFLSSTPWLNVALVGESGPSKPMLFGLDEIGRLQVDGKILCNNCSSYSFYSNLANQAITHLVLTTKQDLLFIVDVDDILSGAAVEKYNNFVHASKTRREEENVKYINIWERGAKIIGILHGDAATVLMQTTRGNLECIYPRKLVLASIINALIEKRFKDAFLLVRKHRIDFNVIVDHCGWQAFILLASEFVKQVENLSHITEFVSAIKNENIMEKLYKHYISFPFQSGGVGAHAQDMGALDANNKVSSVLLAIRKALEEHIPESPSRELCILTTLAQSDPPLLEEALERIKAIRELELSGSDDPRKSSFPSAEEALKHLLWLSDSEAVFEAALGLYDLNLAAIVALNSQRDPKEFLPYLQELERMPSLIMQYNIDLKLRRFESALKHIVSAGEAYYTDCMNLLKKNPQLFPLGLQLIIDPVKRTGVLEAWGDYLNDEKCYMDAATTYLCCSSLEKALKAYRSCGNWRGELTVAGLLKMGDNEILQLAYELCEELQALGKPGEAAKVALEYCGDVNNGIGLLIIAREWEEALRIAFMHKREDLISEVKNASLECANTLIGEYEEGLEKVGKYLTRYLAVRQRRLLLAAKLQAEEKSVNDFDDETASEASSNFSGMSAYTTGTRKTSTASVTSSVTSKAREARRQKSRGKIRPGSPGEEMALVEHLKGMSPTDGAKRELGSLVVCLLMLGDEELARKLQRIAENFQVSQMAAVKLAEDTLSSDILNEQAHSLEHYVRKMRTDSQTSEALSWRSKVFITP